jgi:VWFA-related protein
MRCSDCTLCLRLGCFLGFFTISVGAQTASPVSQNQPTTLSVSTKLVVVDIVVTDGAGNAVRGLRAEDFHLTENGKTQSILSFEESNAAPKAPLAPLKLPQNVFSNLQPLADSGAVNVLLIDALNTPAADQSVVLQQLNSYLTKMVPGTPLAVFSLGTTLRLVQGFTGDAATLMAALENEKTGSSPKTTHLSDSQQDEVEDQEHIELMRQMKSILPGSIEGMQQKEASTQTYQDTQRIKITLQALQILARYLAQIPTRKNLVWFASTFPVTLFPDKSERRISDGGELSFEIKSTSDLLADSRVAIYPVGARGVEILSGSGDQIGGVAPGQASDDAVALNLPSQQTITSENTTSRQGNMRLASGATMEALAAETGGEAVVSTNDLTGSLAHAIANGSHYYTISYAPTDTAVDGKFRRIEIRDPDRKYRLAYRRGYYALNTVQEGGLTKDPLVSLLQRGLPNSTEIPLRVYLQTDPDVDPASGVAGTSVTAPSKKASYGIELNARLGANSFHLAPNGDHAGEIRVEMVGYDRQGKIVKSAASAMVLNFDPVRYASILRAGTVEHVDFDLPSAAESMTLGVLDTQTGKTGTVEILLRSVKPIQRVESSIKQPAAPRTATVASSSGQADKGRIGLIERGPELVEQMHKSEHHITLDVEVTDFAGKPARGLKQSEFTVLDNGKQQAISSFREFDGQTAPPLAEVVLVVDTMNASLQDVVIARQGVDKFLRQDSGHLPIPVSIAFLTERGAKLNNPSKDGNALADDLKKLQTPMRVHGVAQGINGAMDRQQKSITALETLATFEAQKPGRKLVIWVGPGWPLLSAPSEIGEQARRRYFDWIVTLTTSLREARITLYSVTPLNLMPETAQNAFLYKSYLKGVESPHQADSQNLALQVLATHSGGQVLSKSGNLSEQLTRCIADANSYYEISFEASDTEQVQAYHALAVTANVARAEVRTLTSYYAIP